VSLIGDALRRARQEHVEREATERGVLIRRVDVAPRAAPRTSRAVGLTAAASLVGALGLAAAAWWWLPPHLRNAIPSPGTAANGRPTSAPAELPAAAAPHDATSPVPAPRAAAGAPDSPPRRPAAQERAAQRLERPAVAAGPAASAHTGARRVDGSAASGEPAKPAHGQRVYVLDAELGYAHLHLDYLVYKPGAPFGRINGQQVVIGSIVDGFRVDDIGPDAIRLEDSRGPLLLRVH
jgi:hypothetical protein